MIRYRSDSVQQAIVLVLFGVLSLMAWEYMLNQQFLMNEGDMLDCWMPPVAPEQWSPADFFELFFMWAVMMGAMMFPTVMPMTLGFLRSRNKRSHQHPYADAIIFVVGYFTVWSAFCVLATAVQWLLHSFALLSPMMESRNTVLSMTVLMVAGFYQLTPVKTSCLSHCRHVGMPKSDRRKHPFAFGFHHGLYCVGSCWALMFTVFAAGVMNMSWMGLLTLLVLIEKVITVNPGWVRSMIGLSLLAWSELLLLGFDNYLPG